jgi:hypothetical protein
MINKSSPLLFINIDVENSVSVASEKYASPLIFATTVFDINNTRNRMTGRLKYKLMYDSAAMAPINTPISLF